MMSRLFAWLQYLLPKHLLTRLIYRLARIEQRGVKNVLIRGFVRLYDVDTEEAAKPVPDGYPTFNAFFTRTLVDGAREIDSAAESIISPVDGTVSEAGLLTRDRILQAKGIDYTLDDLFSIDLDEAHGFDDGRFATIYLAPYNYHRVHMPFAGDLVAAHYVPGDLFSVNEASVAHIPGLFRRNERLVMRFETATGPAALIFVGAMNVGSISTPWTGEVRPRKRGVTESLALNASPTELAKGDLLGWFNMGSTVILLLPKDSGEWASSLVAGATVRMGEAIGQLTAAAK